MIFCLLPVLRLNIQADKTFLRCRVNSGSSSGTIPRLTATHAQNSFTCIWATFKSSQDHLDCTQNLSSAVKSPECWQHTQLCPQFPQVPLTTNALSLDWERIKATQQRASLAARDTSQDVMTRLEKRNTAERQKLEYVSSGGRAEGEKEKQVVSEFPHGDSSEKNSTPSSPPKPLEI